MPWLPLYADEDDFRDVLSWLNSDADIAFIVADGPQRWRAVARLEILTYGRYCLWHLPSGPLPLLGQGTIEDSQVPDPWAGWQEVRTGAEPSDPYFGSGHPGIVWLNARPVSPYQPRAIGLSSFEWIGNLNRIIGMPAPECTTKWWQRLRRTVKKVAIQIPRHGPSDGPDPEIWAFSSAYGRIQSGIRRDDTP